MLLVLVQRKNSNSANISCYKTRNILLTLRALVNLHCTWKNEKISTKLFFLPGAWEHVCVCPVFLRNICSF